MRGGKSTFSEIDSLQFKEKCLLLLRMTKAIILKHIDDFSAWKYPQIKKKKKNLSVSINLKEYPCHAHT